MIRRAALLSLSLSSCLPNGPPSGAPEQPAPAQATRKRPPPAAPLQAPAANDPLLSEPFSDDFERGSLGPDWRAVGWGAWKIEGGKLCGRSARNRGVWLRRRLPLNARVEVDATSSSPDGDLKLEAWGDGASGATSTSYTNATSYLAILGGWKNTLHVLARLDEHGADRKELRLGAPDDPRAQRVASGQTYRVRIERRDGRTVELWVDDAKIHAYEDDAPLSGPGHDHLGFNDWEAHVCFDNLKVTPL
ncbi:MAG: hypothetical protein IT374_18885 [Polyangiaceae bacterium]|nr:hypothetical protein [Polyangiaceae bacterium]